MKLCPLLREEMSWGRSTREWWAPSSPRWFLEVTRVLLSSVTKQWNHTSPRKHTNATPCCQVLTSCLLFMGKLYLPTQWGQSHRRHYLYWPRTGIYQSDRTSSPVCWWHNVEPCIRYDYFNSICIDLYIHMVYSYTCKWKVFIHQQRIHFHQDIREPIVKMSWSNVRASVIYYKLFCVHHYYILILSEALKKGGSNMNKVCFRCKTHCQDSVV